MNPLRTSVLAAGLAVAAAASLAGCGQPDVTKTRLERAIGPAFANLYVQRADLLGEPGVTVAGIGASAACDRGGPEVADVGPGPDWICMIHFTDDHGQPQDGKFEVQAKADATYVAGGPSKLIGQATLTDSHGHDVPNPVFEFDGAFDPDH
ncbi:MULTISPECIES: hypothetical protein [Micromonospora]|uniref:Lipoprotein n=1 Tax=Micromonospora sicca TaxID=2202420 RepID=A0A317DPI6_9ACTN|nr:MULTISPECIES: hypothetical protein [unclassified Micromonospora]MBM0225828.1 hypothetical protein [Micromonospora sp. ATA51]PWR14713.1 hypothetical protein DKT69_14710 [Micromonospora sp. 4G51]